MKRELAAVLASAGAVALVAIGAVAASNYLSSRPDSSPVSVVPPSTPPGPPVPQRGSTGYPIERWEKLREAKTQSPG